MTPDVQTLYDVVEATWPPASTRRAGPWTVRDGAGGGKRVSAATADGPVTGSDIAAMEAAQAKLGQDPLVMLRAGEDDLDAMLAAAGYEIIDPVVLYAAPIDAVTGPHPPVTAFPHWPPLAMTLDLWVEGGIGPERVAVMERAKGPKTAILARTEDTPAGAAFVAIHQDIAMIHALEVAPKLRRKGAARNMMRCAANWAQDMGARYFSLVVTEANSAARPLYASLNLKVVGNYHYRIKKPVKGPNR